MFDSASPTSSYASAAPRLAVIPARGGSTRVPRKNIRLLHGRPLLAYTIEAALGSGLFAHVVVTTDDVEIAEVSLRSGAEVPFVRSRDLADDVTPVSLVTLDALERVDPEGTMEEVAQLMPNCPLRTADDIRASYAAFRNGSGSTQISVTRFGWQNPWWAFQLSATRQMQALFPKLVARRSQDLPDLFCPTGAVWWSRSEVLRRERTYHVEGRTAWEIPWERGVDIDTEADWVMAEVLMDRSLLPVRGDEA